jgi:iron complex transport system substrate-binding protein
MPRSQVVALALCMLAGACRRAPPPPGAGPTAGPSASCGYPVRLRDDRGVTVTVATDPRRVVSLLPSHTETLFALGAGTRVVGVDDSSARLPEAAGLPRLGGLYDGRREALLSLRPDLVLAAESSDVAALEHAGLTVWGGSAQRFDDVFRVIDAIGQMVCRRTEATLLARRIADDVATIEDRVRGRERVRVYYELDATPYTAGSGSFIGTMLAKAGGDDVVPAALGDFPKISPEAVIASDPAAIFGPSLEEVRARPGWGAIAAVRSGRVYGLTPAEADLVARPGTRIAEGIRILARRLHPEVSL